MAGQISGMISEIKSVSEILDEIIMETENTIKKNYKIVE
jgi:enoyl-[acyl-carrier protein] reductase II